MKLNEGVCACVCVCVYVCVLFGNISGYKEHFLLLYLPDISFFLSTYAHRCHLLFKSKNYAHSFILNQKNVRSKTLIHECIFI